MILSELRANLWKYACIAAAVLAVAAVIGALYFRGSAHAARADRDDAITQRDTARADRDALVELIAIERAKAAESARIAEQYERDKADVEQEAQRVVADLRAGNLRLRKLWEAKAATAELSQATARAASPDGGAADRAESAGRIVRAADACDAQVRGLQALVTADRSGP